jgi:hypothetical protein
MQEASGNRSLPSVWGVICARNEADIIEANLRHHLKLGLAGIVLVDNASDDGTAEIAASVPGVRVFKDRSPYDQASQNRRMTELAMGFGAEWVLTIDADEFWYPTRSDSIPQAVASAAARGWEAFRVPGHSHACSVWDDPSQADPVCRLRWRFTKQDRNSKVAFRCAPGRWAAGGNEQCSDSSTRPPIQYDLWLRHYPVRGLACFVKKIRSCRRSSVHRHIEKWYRALRSNPDAFGRYFLRKCVFGRRKLSRAPWRWVEDPLEPGRRLDDPRMALNRLTRAGITFTSNVPESTPARRRRKRRPRMTREQRRLRRQRRRRGEK